MRKEPENCRIGITQSDPDVLPVKTVAIIVIIQVTNVIKKATKKGNFFDLTLGKRFLPAVFFCCGISRVCDLRHR
ncbi:MAG: hypothetical protein IKO93_10770 [Lentisphaeria bacterium]|nr:hypothetical protein [Lentisphaeria bacterium]